MTVEFEFDTRGPAEPEGRWWQGCGGLRARAAGALSGVCSVFYVFLGFSNLHGLMHITKRGRHFAEKLFWAVACWLALWGLVMLGLQSWRRFQDNPTVVSLERNYKDWNTSFPTVTLCPTAKFTEETLRAVIEEYDSSAKAGIKKLIQELANATYGSFDKVVTDLPKVAPDRYIWFVSKVKFPFQYKVTNSNPENYNVFRLNAFMSEIGICYSYNSDATYYNDPLYWEQGLWHNLGKFPVFQGSPLDGDIFAQMRSMTSGYKLYLHGPSEFPDIAMPGLSSDNGTYKTLDLTAISIVSTGAVKELGVQQRKCRLQTESDLDLSPVYSYNLCRQQCRLRLSLQLCGCVPFFYRPTGKYPVCNVKGLHCLHKHTELLVRLLHPETGKKVECSCFPMCDEVNYMIDADNTMEWSLGTNLKIGFIKYPKIRLKRDIIFGPSDLLVSIGGMAGLFLGCSILSIAEAIYFFFLRPVYLWKYKMPLPFA